LISQPERFGLTQEEARNEIHHVASIVRKWRARFAACGVSTKDIEYISPAMLASLFLADIPPEPL
jgi:serine/threonine-protein kinase HipA